MLIQGQGESNANPERAAVTREKLVRAARKLVIERGYAGVRTAEVLRRAGISRGGLYHHFKGKQELLAAVLDAVERDFMVRLGAAVADQPDPISALSAGAQWYLDECMRSKELQRIGLHEGRKALGWETWRETIAPYGVSLLTQTLAAAMDAGQIRRTDPTTLAYIILAALHEALAIILNGPNPQAERERTGQTITTLIDGLRIP